VGVILEDFADIGATVAALETATVPPPDDRDERR